MPFILRTPKYLENPCFPNDCTAPFSYKNVLSLTNDSTLFTQEVSKQKTSGNLDSPEAGFDAIMQAVVCTVGRVQHSINATELQAKSPVHVSTCSVVVHALGVASFCSGKILFSNGKHVQFRNLVECKFSDNVYTIFIYWFF